jgi:hypothetical protein
MTRKGKEILMKRLAGAVTGTLLLALAAGGGASAKPPVGSCPPKGGEDPFELFAVSEFPGVEFIDLNQNGFVCAFNLPQDPRFFQVIDDVAQVP